MSTSLNSVGPYYRAVRSLAAEVWIAARWLLLKGCASLCYFVWGRRGNIENKIIGLGNLLFGPPHRYVILNSYDDYVRHMPVDLQVYLDLWDPAAWLVDRTVLDLGAGLGQFAEALRQRGARRVVALDCQADKLRHWQERHREGACAAVVGSATTLPLGDSTVDSVFSHTVFEHLSEPSRALAEIRRVLKPGGLALISVNYFQQRGGHHLFPYVHFPWATWVVREETLCRYWSDQLAADHRRRRMRFFAAGTRLHTLSDGAEIHLNKLTFDEFEPLIEQAGLRVARRWSGEAMSRLPVLGRLPRLKYFLQGTIYYVLSRDAVPSHMKPRAPAVPRHQHEVMQCAG